MKLTLLKIVQRALSAIDSQNVSDVSDNPESEQVVHIVNRVYEELLAKRDWPFLREAGINLVSNAADAWELDLPSNLMNLEFIKYNKKNLEYLSPEDFKNKTDARDTTSDDINSDGIMTDRDPQYWSSSNELAIVFDAYDSTYASLLPSLCYIQYMKEETSELTDNSDVPILPARFHSVLMDGVLAVVFDELAQDTTKSQRKEMAYKKGLARMNRWARKIEEALPNYQNNYNFGRSARRWNRSIQSPRVT